MLESLTFLVQKIDGRMKARTCANGSAQREWMDKVDAASPTAAIESIFLTAVAEAKEGRKAITVDTPNAFTQTDVGNDKDGDRIMMKMRGPMVDMLVRLDPELHGDKAVVEGKSKVLCVHIKKAICGMIDSSTLFCKQLRKDLESNGFTVNPCDPCAANKTVNGKQMTVTWHVDDLKASHKDDQALNEFAEWLEEKCGSKENPATVHKGDKHRHLGVTMDHGTKGKVKIDVTDGVEEMMEEFPCHLSDRVTKTPATDDIFVVNESPGLDVQRAAVLHKFVAKSLFLCKRARPDTQVPVAFLTTRVKEPTEQDWFKLLRMMKCLKSTKKEMLTLSADNLHMMKWFADASFAVHPDMKSHTGCNMTMGQGSVISASTKQKIDTKSSTEAELAAADDTVNEPLWSKRFMEAQGCDTTVTLMQDNTSAVPLEKNGKTSSSEEVRMSDKPVWNSFDE